MQNLKNNVVFISPYILCFLYTVDVTLVLLYYVSFKVFLRTVSICISYIIITGPVTYS